MPSFSLADALDPALWRQNFDKRSLTRAKDYLHGISSVEHQDIGNAVVLSAFVKGTAAKPYITTVHIEPLGPGLYEYDSECSCPVEWECKHAAALLMAAAQQFASKTGAPASRERPDPVPEWKAWMNTLAPTQALPSLPAEHSARQIAVIFDVIESTSPAQLIAKLAWVQKTHHGRWGKLESIRLDGLDNDLDTGQLDGLWHDRVARLQIRPVTWHPRHRDMRLLKGANAEALLENGIPPHKAYLAKDSATGQTRLLDRRDPFQSEQQCPRVAVDVMRMSSQPIDTSSQRLDETVSRHDTTAQEQQRTSQQSQALAALGFDDQMLFARIRRDLPGHVSDNHAALAMQRAKQEGLRDAGSLGTVMMIGGDIYLRGHGEAPKDLKVDAGVAAPPLQATAGAVNALNQQKAQTSAQQHALVQEDQAPRLARLG